MSAAPSHCNPLHAAIRALPTREEMNDRIDRLEQRMEAGFAQMRAENKATSRLIITVLVAILGLVASTIL